MQSIHDLEHRARTARVKRPPLARVGNFVILLWVGALWGTQPALIKMSVSGALSEIEALALVLFAVVSVVGVFLVAHGRMPRFTRETLTFIGVAGFLEYAAPLLTIFLLAAHINAGLLTLIVASTPAFTVALAAAVGSEALGRQTVLACLIGLAAIALIVVPEDALPSREMLPWCLAAFAIPVFYSCGSIYVSRNWPAEFDTVQAAFAGALGSSVLLAPFGLKALVAGNLGANPSGASWALMALTFSVVLEMTLYMYLLRRAGPVFASFSSFVMIISGFVIGMAIFGERPSVWIWTSVALFALSLAIILRGHKSGVV